MFGGMNPAKMQAMMKQMGIKQEEIDSSKVIIEKSDGGKVVIENPNVVKINMQGNESFQITGDVREGEGESDGESGESEAEEEGFSEDDIKMIMEKTGKPLEAVKESLDKTGDIAETIMELSD